MFQIRSAKTFLISLVYYTLMHEANAAYSQNTIQ